MSFSFVHCSDIHLLDLQGTRPRSFVNKRLTGGLNLLLKRGKAHDGRLFDGIVDAARRHEVDRLVITGDLTNLALQSEFDHVARKLAASEVPATVIPGNHDAYTRGSARARRFENSLDPHMQGERLGGADYPYVQRYGDVALVGCSSAEPSLPLFATGRVGPEQLDRLDTVLERLGDEGLTRVVLIHHPVVDGHSKPRHDLLDIRSFARIIKRRGAELVLHGHEHQMLEGHLPGPKSTRIPVHGITSGTSLSTRAGRAAAFSLYRIEGGQVHRDVHVWGGDGFNPET